MTGNDQGTAIGGAGSLDRELLVRGARHVDEALGESQLDLFSRYSALIVEWNRRLNLTRLEDPERVAIEHFADSLACLKGVPGDLVQPGADETPGLGPDAAESQLRCVDVGSGVGLPGLALKIARPHWEVTLVEATAKRAGFLQHAVDQLRLTSTAVRCSRVEIVGREVEYRERYDVAVARALAPLAVLAEYMLPLLRIGGRMIAMKGASAADEIAAAYRAIELLGGGDVGVVEYRLPNLESPRLLVTVDKTKPTPDKYPRRPGIPAKRPLR